MVSGQEVQVPARGAPTDAEARSLRAVRELRDPLDGIMQSLQRLSLHSAFELRQTPECPHLLHRARALAGELRGVVDTLLDAPRNGERRERRVHSETISVITAFEDASAAVGDALSGRHVTASCPPKLTVTTDATLFCELLSLLLRESARETGEVHAIVKLSAGELAVNFAGLHARASAGHSLDRIQSLAAKLGGRIDVVTHPEPVAGVRLRLPQQRAGDGSRTPDSQSWSG